MRADSNYSFEGEILHIFLFYSSHAGSLGAGPIKAIQEMTLTIHFAINVFSVPQIFFIPQPKHPPDGWITDVVMKCFVTIIFGGMMSNCLCRCYAVIWLRFVRKKVRRILNANWFLFILKIGKISVPSCVKCPFYVPFGVSFYVSQFSFAENITMEDLLLFFTRHDHFDAADLFHYAKSGIEHEIFFFDVGDGCPDTITIVAAELCDKSRVHVAPVLLVAHALVSALATSGEEETGGISVAAFDSASSFWVCDNSATGHICNSKKISWPFGSICLDSQYCNRL